jgi:hypothetical protein
VDTLGVNDATNISNYVLTGPSSNAITYAAAVMSDPQAIDITVAAPLVAGTWTIDCSVNIQMATGRPLQSPRSMNFVVTFVTGAEPLVSGVVTDSCFEIIKKHSNPSAFKGTVWDALRAGLAAGDALIVDTVQKAFDQLFTSTASGKYLDRKAADRGLRRPTSIGMSDELFRDLVNKFTSSKVTQESILEILEVFYGPDAVRGYADTTVNEPYVLEDGQYLDINLDGRDDFRVLFNESDFAQITQAQAIEVAAVITAAFRNQGNNSAYAASIVDTSTNDNKVRIYSGSKGLSSSVTITGGWAQTGLLFPTPLLTYVGDIDSSDAYDWVIDHPDQNSTRFTLELDTFGYTPLIDLSTVQEGDYVAIQEYASQVTNSDCVSDISSVDIAFTISGGLPTTILSQSFTIDEYIDFTGIARQLSTLAYRFYRPTKNTIQRNDRRTVVVSQHNGQADIVIPATSQAVNRTEDSGAYLPANTELSVSSIYRNVDGLVTVTTSTNHGMVVGDRFQIEGASGSLDDLPTLIPYQPPGVIEWSEASIFADVPTPDTIPTVIWHTLTELPNGTVLKAGGGYGPSYSDTTGIFGVGDFTDIDGRIRKQITWSVGPPLEYGAAPYPLKNHAATLMLNTNKVLFSGGIVAGPTSVNTTFFLDTNTLVYSDGPNMSTVRYDHQSISLDSGLILIIGGHETYGVSSTNTCDLYNPTTNGIVPGGAMIYARGNFASVKLSDGRVLVAGGYNITASEFTADCEIYDPSTDTWTQTGRMAYSRIVHELVLLPNDRVLCIGGFGHPVCMPGASAEISSVEMWDPVSEKWTPVCTMPFGRQYPLCHLLPSGKVLVSFGYSTVTNVYPSHFIDTLDDFKVSSGPTYDAGTHDSIMYVPKGLLLSNDTVLFNGGIPGATDDGPTALFVQGSDQLLVGGLNGEFAVKGTPTATSFTYETLDYPFYTKNTSSEATVLPVAAPAANDSPFIYDIDEGVSVTSSESALTQSLAAGQQYAVLGVADSSVFPDEEGYLCVNFGYANATYPIPYLGRYSSTGLIIDYRFVFPYDVDSGAIVSLMNQREAYVPDSDTTGEFWLTSSPSGRVVAIDIVEQAMAGGIEINSEVVYPGDKGLGGYGLPTTGAKISEIVEVFGGNTLDEEIAEAHDE